MKSLHKEHQNSKLQSENKVCTRCGIAKPLASFYIRKEAKSGYQSHCKSCKNERGRVTALALFYRNHEARKAISRVYHQKHRDRRNEAIKEWRRKRREKKLAEIASHPTVVIPDTHKICAECKYPKELECFWKSSACALGRQSVCIECQTRMKATRYQERRAEVNASTQAWAAKNRDKVNAIARAYHQRHNESSRARSRKWHHDNPWSGAERRVRRQLASRRAKPAWRNEFIIGETYATARDRTKATGVRHSVDHVVPLQSDLVCGLHVEHNLQVIPYIENISKGNRRWPDMW